MHILTATLFGLCLWLPLTLYHAATSNEPWLMFALGPFIVSGSALGLLLFEVALEKALDLIDPDDRREPAE